MEMTANAGIALSVDNGPVWKRQQMHCCIKHSLLRVGNWPLKERGVFPP